MSNYSNDLFPLFLQNQTVLSSLQMWECFHLHKMSVKTKKTRRKRRPWCVWRLVSTQTMWVCPGRSMGWMSKMVWQPTALPCGKRIITALQAGWRSHSETGSHPTRTSPAPSASSMGHTLWTLDTGLKALKVEYVHFNSEVPKHII